MRSVRGTVNVLFTLRVMNRLTRSVRGTMNGLVRSAMIEAVLLVGRPNIGILRRAPTGRSSITEVSLLSQRRPVKDFPGPAVGDDDGSRGDYTTTPDRPGFHRILPGIERRNLREIVLYFPGQATHR